MRVCEVWVAVSVMRVVGTFSLTIQPVPVFLDTVHVPPGLLEDGEEGFLATSDSEVFWRVNCFFGFWVSGAIVFNSS